MSRVFVSGATGAAVYVFSNDHCPPHISARHRGEEWIARVQFSYLDDKVGLWSIEPIRHTPTQRVINRLLDDTRAQLSSCRRIWWNIHRTVCLDNQRVLLSEDGSVTLIAERTPEAKQIVEAIYDATTERLRLQISDGTNVEVR